MSELYKHKKRGTVYELIGIGRMQSDSWIDEAKPAPVDFRQVVIYRNVNDPTEIWARPREEFEDGRFALLTSVK